MKSHTQKFSLSFFRKGLLLLISLLFLSFFPPQQEETHIVEIKNMKFVPAEIKVARGEKVVFINKDMVIHNVTEEKKNWASPTIAPKDSWTYTATTELNYYCSFHPMMKGTIKIR